MIKNILVIIFSFLIGCVPPTTSIPGPKGDLGPKGPRGAQGPKGLPGPKGNNGKSIPEELVKKIENSLNNANDEIIVGTLAYSFGIAPRITGFSYLTSSGKVFKLENKNPQKFGSEIKLVTQISKEQKFVSFGRTTFGDDIKQLFTAVSINGDIYISEKLDSWTKVVTIPLSE